MLGLGKTGIGGGGRVDGWQVMRDVAGSILLWLRRRPSTWVRIITISPCSQ